MRADVLLPATSSPRPCVVPGMDQRFSKYLLKERKGGREGGKERGRKEERVRRKEGERVLRKKCY